MGSEKRILPILLVAFAATFLLQIFFPPPKKAAPGGVDAPGAAETADAQGEGAPALDAPGEETPGSEEAEAAPAAAAGADPWSEWKTFGAPGDRGYMAVRFDSLGGSVAEIRLGNFFDRIGLTDEERADREHWVHLVDPAVEAERTLQTLMTRAVPGTRAAALLSADPGAVHWTADELDDGVRFAYEDASGVILEKTIRAVPGQNQLAVELTARTDNEAHVGKLLDLRLVAAVGMRPERQDSTYPAPRAVAAKPGDEPISKNINRKGGDRRPNGDEFCSGRLAYVGTHTKYFATVLRPAADSSEAALSDAIRVFVYDGAWAYENYELREEAYLDLLAEAKVELTLAGSGEPSGHSYVLYAGPKNKDHFTEGEAGLAEVMREDLGFFDGIASVILGYLRFLHGIVGNWGWAIIFLTLTVRMLLFPLQRKMQTSMARHATKMKRVQPKLDAIKEKYKNDAKKLREEQARLFQQEGALPPVGGCLPMFLQIPIFFGLFSALRVSSDLRQAPFALWIRDLSAPDHMFATGLSGFPSFLPDLSWFNLLPILMVVLWIGQQKVMPKPAAMNEQQAQMQKIMMWMPIMFGVFLYDYAAGLSLYMITTSMFGILESTVIRKVWPIDDAEQPKKQSRFMKKLSALQEQALQMQEQQRKMQQAQAQQRRGGKRKGR
ncbi:MAG: membrane protein insertase YidC [Planctomycetota bacterium]